MAWIRRPTLTAAIGLAALVGPAVAQPVRVKVGVLNDMSGVYSDTGGKGSVVAAQMAVEDFAAIDTGIGQAAAVALAKAGVRLALTGRGQDALDRTAGLVREAGGEALMAPADLRVSEDVQGAWDAVRSAYGRCDILVNSAGLNVPKRSWGEITPADIDAVIGVDLNGPFYASRAVLPTMRAQRGGLIIQVSSWAGRHVSKLTGPAYSAAKHGLVALSESLNQEECGHGIRSCCICPGEVATPLLDKRPVPVTAVDKGRMLQSEDLAETIVFVARLPPSVCVNEILISPTWNRGYLEGVKL